LHGWLDYFHEDLIINVGEGRHRLMISDESSSISMGAAGSPAVLAKSSLTNIKEGLGDIHFSAEGGHWSAGFNLWLGNNSDYLSVVSVPANTDGSGLRTATSVHAGSGNDELTVSLDASTHYGVIFVANGQAGNDLINGSLSSVPMVLFGDGGDDHLITGSGKLFCRWQQLLARQERVIFQHSFVVQSAYVLCFSYF